MWNIGNEEQRYRLTEEKEEANTHYFPMLVATELGVFCIHVLFT